MQEMFRVISSDIALALESLSILMIVVGSLEALGKILMALIGSKATQFARRAAWLSLARWLVLSLEFLLAADIVRTAIAPTWSDIGQLAAIAAIRTFLNFFLEHDLETASQMKTPNSAVEPTQ